MCPWNSSKLVQITTETDYTDYPVGGPQAKGGSDDLSGTTAPELIRLLGMDEKEWDAFSRGRPIRRAKRAGFLRNVTVAMGNWGSPEAVPALIDALGDEEPLVRGHAAWALGRIGTAEAREALEARLG